MTLRLESYIAPINSAISSYEVLLRRGFMIALRNRADQPLEGWTEDYELLIYENDEGAIMATGNWNPDGSLSGGITWGQGGRIEARDLEDFLDQVAHYDSYYH